MLTEDVLMDQPEDVLMDQPEDLQQRISCGEIPHDTEPQICETSNFDDHLVPDLSPEVMILDSPLEEFDPVFVFESSSMENEVAENEMSGNISVSSSFESTFQNSSTVLEGAESPGPNDTSLSWQSRKFCQRKYSSIVEAMKDAKTGEKEIILRKLCNSDREFDIFMKTNVNYLKALIKNAKRSSGGKTKLKEKLQEIYKEYLDDFDFLLWLSRLLNTSSTFLSLVLTSAKEEKYGRKMSPIANRQDIYNFWKSNSELSVHRSNDRHIVKILKRNLKIQVQDITDEWISDAPSKKYEKKKAHRRITLHPYHILHKIYCDTHDFQPSFSSFLNLKPFYMSTPSDKEVELCMCSNCLNPHSLYKAIRKNAEKELPYSLTEYLSKGIKCFKDATLDFVPIECIQGKCGKGCEPLNVQEDLVNEDEATKKKVVSYYLFERVNTEYFDTNGQKKIYKRTTRVDHKGLFVDIIKKLDECSRNYLKHRYRVANDNIYWKKLLNHTDQQILWLDYSQNINFKEKRQVQSAHFSGKQFTLHCSLNILPNGSKNYIYHISSDTNHDSVLTFEILRDIINHYPEIIKDGILIIRSDNCEDQYKCKFTFQEMINLAKDLNISIYWFYGTPGHGRGLIDAMSSFGCKQPLKRHILTNDAWFPTAESMVEFLKVFFKEDITKKHFLVDESITASTRSKPRDFHILRPCRQFHLIAVNSAGEFQKVLFYKGQDLKTIFGTNEDTEMLDIDVEDEEDDAFTLDVATVAELVQPCTYVGVRTPPSSLESFFLCEVIETGVASEFVEDAFGHIVEEGEWYAKVSYLQKYDENQRYVKYERSRKQREVLIRIAEVFATNIVLESDLKMAREEYQAIESAALSV